MQAIIASTESTTIEDYSTTETIWSLPQTFKNGSRNNVQSIAVYNATYVVLENLTHFQQYIIEVSFYANTKAEIENVHDYLQDCLQFKNYDAFDFVADHKLLE